MNHTDNPTFFKFLINNIREVVAYHSRDGLYEFITPSCATVTGYDPSFLIGKSPFDFIHPDDIKYFKNRIFKLLLEGKNDLVAEYRFKCSDGNYIWVQSTHIPIVNEAGEVTNIISGSRDISDLMQLQDELRKNETMFTEASRLANLGAWEMDPSTRMLYWTKDIYKIFDLDYDYFLNYDHLSRFLKMESRELLDEAVEKVQKEGGTFDHILQLITLKKNHKWVRVIGQAIIEEDKPVQRIFGVLQDITEEQETKKELSRVNAQMKWKNKQLQDFANIIAHNLRGPTNNLNVLIQYATEAKTEEERAEFFSLLQDVSGSIHSILEDLIQFVAMKAETDADIEYIKFDKVCDKVLLQFKNEIVAKKANIQTNFSSLPEIEYIQIYLESILYNLISNALKYSDDTRSPEIEIRTFMDGNKKVLEVSDNGLGINLDRYGKNMFKLHRTFHKDRNGKGFGLFMTKDQVVSMGGQISVDSTEGEGSTFKVVFNERELKV